MTKINKDKIGKAAVMIISGLLIGFFPGVINRLFYIVGALVIAVSVILMIMKLISGSGISSVVNNIIGIIVGIVINALPSFVNTGIPLIAGIIIGFSGIDRLVTSISYGGGKRNIIMGAVLIIIAGVLIFNTAAITKPIRIIIGLVLIGMGIFNLFDKGKFQPSGDVIDVDNYNIS